MCRFFDAAVFFERNKCLCHWLVLSALSEFETDLRPYFVCPNIQLTIIAAGKMKVINMSTVSKVFGEMKGRSELSDDTYNCLNFTPYIWHFVQPYVQIIFFNNMRKTP